MKKKYILILLSIMIAGYAKAQSVIVDATIDSLQILIGEQTDIKLQVAMDANQHASFPIYKDTLINGVEIIDVAKLDTQYLNDRQRMIITQTYTVTSFDSALYYLPPMEVKVDEKSYASKPLALKVYSYAVPLDTLHPDFFFAPKGVMTPIFKWEDWIGMILCILLIAPIIFVLIYLVKRLRDNKPIIRKVKVEPKLPPHQAAMLAIERIKGEKSWKDEDAKQYYTQLTEVIRTYIRDRFDFNALEMTSSEILEMLHETTDKESLKELRELLMTADLVKFAKYKPMINENDANLINAVEFIDETKLIEDVNKKPEPTEITIIEKRSLRTKILLISGIVGLSIALVFAIVFVCVQLYNLFA